MKKPRQPSGSRLVPETQSGKPVSNKRLFPNGEWTSAPHYNNAVTGVKRVTTQRFGAPVDSFETEICAEQMAFFRQGKAGCAFAAFAARRPHWFGWRQSVLKPDIAEIEDEILQAVEDKRTTTLSLIFPSVCSTLRLWSFVERLSDSQLIFRELDAVVEGVRCVGLRARLLGKKAWITGFADLAHMPKTRRAPFTELTLRTKDRPEYEVVMKDAPSDTLHLADLHIPQLSKNAFKRYWDSSFEKTRMILGHKPDLRSAAKTSFVFPVGVTNVAIKLPY